MIQRSGSAAAHCTDPGNGYSDRSSRKEGVLDTAQEVQARLGKVCRAKLDDSDKSPGWKFSEQEMRGIPLRVEFGPKDIENNQCVLVRRDTREKVVVSLDEVETKVPELLETIQKDMFERAKAHRDAHITDAHNYEEFCNAVENKPGFIRGMWCGDQCLRGQDQRRDRCYVQMYAVQRSGTYF